MCQQSGNENYIQYIHHWHFSVHLRADALTAEKCCMNDPKNRNDPNTLVGKCIDINVGPGPKVALSKGYASNLQWTFKLPVDISIKGRGLHPISRTSRTSLAGLLNLSVNYLGVSNDEKINLTIQVKCMFVWLYIKKHFLISRPLHLLLIDFQVTDYNNICPDRGNWYFFFGKE